MPPGAHPRRAKPKINLRVVVLLFVAVIAAAGYASLHMYSRGQHDAITVELRALAISSGLSLHKRETGELPKSLDLLVPKYIPVLGKCPDGAPFEYTQKDEGEYQLVCAPVFYGANPYRYDSKSRAWTDN